MRAAILNLLHRSRPATILLFLAALSSTACQKPAAPPVPVGLAVVQGDNQSAQAGTELPAPIVVRLVDAEGAPVPDFPVGFLVATGGGTVNPSAAPTNENGEVSIKWTLGPSAVQTIYATAGNVAPAPINATGLLPSDVIVAQGTEQVARAGAALPNPIVIRVVGPNNVPMKGIAVAFQVVSGGGLINPQSGVTNVSGELQTRWTLGPSTGIHLLQVIVGALQPVIIAAQAN